MGMGSVSGAIKVKIKITVTIKVTVTVTVSVTVRADYMFALCMVHLVAARAHLVGHE